MTAVLFEAARCIICTFLACASRNISGAPRATPLTRSAAEYSAGTRPSPQQVQLGMTPPPPFLPQRGHHINWLCANDESLAWCREAKEKNRESWYMAYIMDTNEEERAKGKTVEVGASPLSKASLNCGGGLPAGIVPRWWQLLAVRSAHSMRI